VKALEETKHNQRLRSLNYLAEVHHFNPVLKKHGIELPLLANVSARISPLWDTIVLSDPYCALRIAALCGNEKAVDECLNGKDPLTQFDIYGRDIAFYYALGGNVDCLRRFIKRHFQQDKTPFDRDHFDPDGQLAFAAAFGGSVPVLKYLCEELDYDLTEIVRSNSDADDIPPETILTAAIGSGNTEAVDFVLAKNVDPKSGYDPAYCASIVGQWELYERFSKDQNPITSAENSTEFALEIAKNALLTGNLDLALELIEEYELETSKLKLAVVQGGHPKVFWHFVDKGWLSLADTFEKGATVQHLLAQQGDLELLTAVLSDERAAKAKTENADDEKSKRLASFFVQDNEGWSLFHYAAAGGQWIIYCYLRTILGENTPIPVNNSGATIAHIAAASGSVWFLQHLNETEEERQLIHSVNKTNKATVLHAAAYSPDPLIIMMLTDDEFKLDPAAIDDQGNTVVHYLAWHAYAKDDSNRWEVIMALLIRFPEKGLLDIPNHAGTTVRELIYKYQAEEYFTEETLNNNQRGPE